MANLDAALTTFVAILRATPPNIGAITSALTSKPDLATHQLTSTGQSALMVAASLPSLPLTTLLIDHGAVWNALDRKQLCAGDYAVTANSQATVDYLVNVATTAELILGESLSNLNLTTTTPTPSNVKEESSTKRDYLHTSATYSSTTGDLIDKDGDAVMMEWERPLMALHASIITHNEGETSITATTKTKKNVLNVGFGMGIIDTYLQQYEPENHYIMEAHPDVLAKMEKDGWGGKGNVTILKGRWQDTYQAVIDSGVRFDGIFFDT